MDLEQIINAVGDMVPEHLRVYLKALAGICLVASMASNFVPPSSFIGKVLHWLAGNFRKHPPKLQPVPNAAASVVGPAASLSSSSTKPPFAGG